MQHEFPINTFESGGLSFTFEFDCVCVCVPIYLSDMICKRTIFIIIIIIVIMNVALVFTVFIICSGFYLFIYCTNCCAYKITCMDTLIPLDMYTRTRNCRFYRWYTRSGHEQEELYKDYMVESVFIRVNFISHSRNAFGWHIWLAVCYQFHTFLSRLVRLPRFVEIRCEWNCIWHLCHHTHIECQATKLKFVNWWIDSNNSFPNISLDDISFNLPFVFLVDDVANL